MHFLFFCREYALCSWNRTILLPHWSHGYVKSCNGVTHGSRPSVWSQGEGSIVRKYRLTHIMYLLTRRLCKLGLN